MGGELFFSWKNNSLCSDIFSGEKKSSPPMPRLNLMLLTRVLSIMREQRK